MCRCSSHPWRPPARLPEASRAGSRQRLLQSSLASASIQPRAISWMYDAQMARRCPSKQHTPAPSGLPGEQMFSSGEPRSGNGPIPASGTRSPLRLACTRLVLAAIALLAIAASAVSNALASHDAPVAQAARALAFNINASLHRVGPAGHVLNEKGSFSGTQSGTIAVRFTFVNAISGSATFVAYSSRGGSVSGRATIRGHIGATVYFTGIVTITGGTGRWTHASGRNLRFSGTVDPNDFHAGAHIDGTINV